MCGTRKIVLDHYTLLRICNALNAEAAAFETHATANHIPRDSQFVLHTAARDNRNLTSNLINQWEKAGH